MHDETSETSALARRFLRVMEVLGKLSRHQMPDNFHHRLTLNHIHALHMLYYQPGMAQKELAERLNITEAAVSGAVRELERFGLIERRKESKLMRLFLTEQGQASINEAHSQRCNAAANLLSALPLEEQRMVVEALERAMKARQDESNIST